MFQLALALALFLICTPAIAGDTTGDAYLFNLHQYDWGQIQLFVSKDGIKKTYPKQKLVILGTKPKFNLIAFWHTGKQICEIGYDGSQYDRGPIVLPPNIKVHRVRTTLKGLSVFKEKFYYKPQEFDETDSFAGFFMPSGNAAKSRVTLIGCESFRFEDPSFSPALIEAAGRMFDVVPSHGIAVQNCNITTSGSRSLGYTLVNWQRVRTKPNEFEIPKNYRRCKNFKELLAKAMNADIEDLAKQMDFGRPLGKEDKN